MQFEEMLKRERAKGQNEGKTEMLELVLRMIADGKTEQVSRLKEDEELYEEMLKEYNL